MPSCKPPTCTGDMKHLVTVEEPVRVPDGAGGFLNDDWQKKIDVYCKIQQSSGWERFNHQMVEAPTTFIFWTRFGADVKAIDRLCFNEEVYNIRSVEDYENEGRYLKITAERGVLD